MTHEREHDQDLYNNTGGYGGDWLFLAAVILFVLACAVLNWIEKVKL